eukprot:1143981-Pelagomonas_calceolata.AAC.9
MYAAGWINATPHNRLMQRSDNAYTLRPHRLATRHWTHQSGKSSLKASKSGSGQSCALGTHQTLMDKSQDETVAPTLSKKEAGMLMRMPVTCKCSRSTNLGIQILLACLRPLTET